MSSEKIRKTRRDQRIIGKARRVFQKERRKKLEKKRDEQREEKTRITKKWNKKRKTWINDHWLLDMESLATKSPCRSNVLLVLSIVVSTALDCCQCSSRQLQVNWISSARILSFRPRLSVDCNSCSATIFNLFCSI